MKAALWAVPGVRNYDIKNSQATILMAQMEEDGVDPKWLRLYGHADDGKGEAAEYVGVSEATWKRILYATLMGAWTPRASQLGYSSGAIKRALLAEVGAEGLYEAYARFQGFTAGLRDELSLWHRLLVSDFLQREGWTHPKNGNVYVRNAAGVSVAVQDLAPNGKAHTLKATLSAFLLQGREACVIHTLVASAAQHGFQVWAVEHDGLVTNGPIPTQAVDAAVEAAGLRRSLIDLIEKPFI